MSIKLKGSTDGSVTLQAPADTSPTGTDKTFTLPTQDGTAQQVLKTDGSGNLSFTDNLASGRNLLINGDFRIAQRGTSFTSVASVYTLDRWFFGGASTTGMVVSQNLVGDINSLRITGAGLSNSVSVDQPIETENLKGHRNQQVTFSCGHLGSGNHSGVLAFYYSTSTDARSQPGWTLLATQAFNITTSFGTSSITATIPANAIGFLAQINIDSGLASGATVDLFNAQLEPGPVATTFEHTNYGDELARCQRYFQKHHEARLRGVAGAATSLNRLGMTLPVTMRIAPAVTSTGTFAWYDGSNIGQINSFTVTYTTKDSVELDSANSQSVPNAMTGTSVATNPIIIYNSINVHGGELLINAEL